jgi:hypothetical protein
MLSATITQASPLGPGGTLYPSPSSAGPAGASLLLDGGIPVPFASANYSGTLTTSVLSGNAANPFGLNALTFTFVLTSDQTSNDMIDRLTTNGWSGFLADASYQLPATGLAPAYIDRLTSNVVGFGFLNAPLGPGVLMPGSSTAVFVVNTDATSYQPSFASVIDGTVTTVSSFSPAIPEPATLVLLASGGLLVGFRRRRVS